MAQLTTDIYWKSKHPDVRALRGMERMSEERVQKALELAAKGHLIDAVIDTGRWDAAAMMAAREAFGFTWVPSITQDPIAIMPGLEFPGLTYDPDHPPVGSIKVSTRAEDYPPFDIPVVKPPVVLPAVGSSIGGGYYHSNETESAAGARITHNGRTFEKVLFQGFAGTIHYWREVAQ